MDPLCDPDIGIGCKKGEREMKGKLLACKECGATHRQLRSTDDGILCDRCMEKQEFGQLLQIESAPRDGTHIIGYWKDGRFSDDAFHAMEIYWNLDWEVWESEDDCNEEEPTYWMPLPDPPVGMKS